MNQTEDRLVPYSGRPNITELQKDFQRCAPVNRGWHVTESNEEVRFAVWPGQSPDGRKHGSKEREAMPWEGASDVRVYLADSQIREDVAVLVQAFWRALHALAAKGVEAGDDEYAARTTSLLKWTLNRQKHELMRQVELSAQYLLTYGMVVLNPSWRRETGYQWRQFTLEQFRAAAEAEERMLAAQAGASPSPLPSPAGRGSVAELLALILDPAMEAEAVALVQAKAAELVRMQAETVLGMDLADELLGNYTLSKAKARMVVRDLRQKGRTEIPLPYVCKNDPCVMALKVYEEVFFASETTDMAAARVHHLEWLTEAQLRTRAHSEGWDEAWLEEAVKQKGVRSVWADEADHRWSEASRTGNWSWRTMEDMESDLIEVIHSTYDQVDEDGIPVRVHTVWHSGVMKLEDSPEEGHEGEAVAGGYALHEVIRYEHGQMPYVAGTLENLSRRLLDTRGYPELLATRQNEVKVQRDAIIDATSLSVLPPLNKYDRALQSDYVFGPGAQNPVTRGFEPQLMDIKTPGVAHAFDLMEMVRVEVDNEFGSLSEKVNPVRAQAKKQMLINCFLRLWSAALAQQFGLMQQYITPEEMERITGWSQGNAQGTALSRGYDIQLSFDARDLDIEYMKAQAEVLQALFAVDRNGIMDTDRYIEHGLRALNPSLADEILARDRMGATEKIYREVQADVQLMMGGFQPKRLVDADPTAAARLQFAQKIAQENPKVMQAMQDPQFAALAEEYMKNLQFAAEQNQNKAVGRTGVK